MVFHISALFDNHPPTLHSLSVLLSEIMYVSLPFSGIFIVVYILRVCQSHVW